MLWPLKIAVCLYYKHIFDWRHNGKITGKTVAENLAGVPDLKPGQQIVYPWEKPINPRGHLRILRGNLAPDGAVAKITGTPGLGGDAAYYATSHFEPNQFYADAANIRSVTSVREVSAMVGQAACV